MTTIISYPQTLSQTTGGKYSTWSSLANLKNNTTGSHAITHLIKGKTSTPNRPSIISATNFKLNIPTGAKVTSIKVEYRHRLDPYNNKYPNINAPTISLLGVKGYSKKGVAAGKTLTTRSVTFKPAKAGVFTATALNSKDFGVKLDYPTNADKDSGYVRLSYIRVTVNYKEPAYTVSWSCNPKTPENDSTVDVSLKISNKNKVDYKPTFTITTPAGFTLASNPSQGKDPWVKVGNRTYTWTPSFTSSIGSITKGLKFNVSVTGTLPVSATFDAVESLTGDNGSLTVSVVEKTPVSGGEDEPDTPDTGVIGDDYLLQLRQYYNEEGAPLYPYFYINFTDDQKEKYNQHGQGEVVVIEGVTYAKISYISLVWTDKDNGTLSYSNLELENTTQLEVYTLDDPAPIPHDDFTLDDEWKLRAYINGVFVFKLRFFEEVKYYNPSTGQEVPSMKEEYYTDIGLIYFNSIPQTLTTPTMSIMTLSPEELDRLGDGEVYTVQSYMKQTTSEDALRDWGKNFRIGVSNTSIPATVDEIYENAEYWSPNQAGYNEYNAVECEFAYDKDYPLYILLVDDYPEGDQSNNTISYTEPCIIESDYYNGMEPNGNYPIPINNTINHEGATATNTIPVFENTTPIVIYDLDLEEEAYEDDDTAIRGIAVELTFDEYTDSIITAQLKAPNGNIGERSTILTEENLSDDNVLTIGGVGDLWAFTTSDLVNLNQFELILTIQNSLTETEISILEGNAQIIFYTEQFTEQKEYCTIDGEDIRYYGAFITDIDIPQGLETDTSFLSIDGTDTNDAYMQNIREKTITMELEIGDNCNLTEATDTLRQLTQLLLPRRDEFNRPIPKRINFSFQPDIYYEYIIKDTFDNPIEISSYSVKVKLTIPSGTAYKTNTTLTNTTGYVQGLAKVNPLISFKPTGNSIEITETVSGQKFTIHYPEETSEIMVIDCENRRLYLQNDEDSTEHTDITRYVDFNSDWFHLQGEYIFTATNAYIRTVEYTERW